MKEIVNRLHENKQIKLAKEILESHGYKVTKKNESTSGDDIAEALLDEIESTEFTLAQYNEEQEYDEDIMAESEIICSMLGEDPEDIVIAECPVGGKEFADFLGTQKEIKSESDSEGGSLSLYDIKGVGKIVVGYNSGEINIIAPIPPRNRDGVSSGKYGDVKYIN